MLDGVASVLTSPHVFVGVLERRDDIENCLDASPHVDVGVLVALVTLSWSFDLSVVKNVGSWQACQWRP